MTNRKRQTGCEEMQIIYIWLFTSIFMFSFPQPLRAKKIASLRLFPDPASNKAWDKSVSDLGLEILCVSQVWQQKSMHSVCGFKFYR